MSTAVSRSTTLYERVARALAIAFLAAFICGQTLAAERPPERIDAAPVVIDGSVLFAVAGASSLPAKRRAAGIANRIKEVAADASFDTSNLKIVPLEDNLAIYAGSLRIMVVAAVDAELDRLSPDVVALVDLTKIQAAINDYREARAVKHLIRGSLYTGTATLFFALLAVSLWWLAARAQGFVERKLHSHIRPVGIQAFEILRAEHIRGLIIALLKGACLLAFISLLFAWLRFVLTQFPWTVGYGNALFVHVMDPLAAVARGVVDAIPNVIFLFVFYYAVRAGLRIVRLFFDAVERGAVKMSGFESEWASPTYKLVRFAISALALAIAYPYIPGSDSAAFKGLSLFLGIVITLTSSTSVSNIVAGYMMIYRRTFRLGDRVKISEILGDVTAMRLQVTHLRTPQNEEVLIPNSQIINGNVTNFSTLAAEHGLLLRIKVGIGYETPWRQVEAMLIEAARHTEGLADDPAPFVLKAALGDFSISYELYAGCHDAHQMLPLYSALYGNVLDVFNENNVQIMTPSYIADPPAPKVVPKDNWFLALAPRPRQQ